MEQSNELSFNVIQTIKKVVLHLKDSKLLPVNLEEIEKETALLSEYLGLTDRQSWLFCIAFVKMIENSQFYSTEFVSHIGLEAIDLIDFKQDIDILIEKKFLEVDDHYYRKTRKLKISRATLAIPDDLSHLIFENLPINAVSKFDKMDIYQLCSKVSDSLDARQHDFITTEELLKEVEKYERLNEELEVVKKLQKLSTEDRIILYETCNCLVVSGQSCSLERTLSDLYDHKKFQFTKMREITEKKSQLCTFEYITLSNGYFGNETKMDLTEKSIELFMGLDADIFLNRKLQSNQISSDKIPAKELFFDSQLSQELSFLKQCLMSENFNSLQNRLENQSLSKGVAAIFYGLPGTGKTEMALQIARETGRDIIPVDISQTKSMWFGESEKVIKDIFSSYANVCSKSILKPILLFNEADAVFGTRKNERSGSLSQTENAIQNIILEEIEKLEGIMIATTNLVGNLDSAFERRFLFKLKFNNPDNEVKKQIWKSKLTWLEDSHISQLSSKYDFSGGEIDNIVKKTIMNEVLIGSRPSYNELINFCNTEKLSSQNQSAKLGF